MRMELSAPPTASLDPSGLKLNVRTVSGMAPRIFTKSPLVGLNRATSPDWPGDPPAAASGAPSGLRSKPKVRSRTFWLRERRFAFAGFDQPIKAVEAEMAFRFFRTVAGDAFAGQHRGDIFAEADRRRPVVRLAVLSGRRSSGGGQSEKDDAGRKTHWPGVKFQNA